MRHSHPMLAIIGTLTLTLWTGQALAQDAAAADKERSTKDEKAPVLRLRAFAIDMNRGGTAATGTQTLDIVIERWSTDAELQQLRDALVEKGGGDALLAAVQKIKPRAGFIRTTTSLGWDIQYARQTDLPGGGRRIVVGTDRPMGFWEAANRPRSADYEYLLAEIRLGKDGKGDGRLAPAAMVAYDEGTRTIEVENFEQLPIQLSQVEVVK